MSKFKVLGLTLSIVLGGFVVFWIITGRWLIEGLEPKADGTNNYAIILGAKVNGVVPSLSLKYRLDAALELVDDYPSTLFILSGGQGPDEDISEAQAMRIFLIDNGVAENQLILEDKSTSTYENFKFSKALIPSDITSLTIITSDYHLSRAKKVAQTLGFETDVVAAKTPDSIKLKVRTRERIALLKTYLVGK